MHSTSGFRFLDLPAELRNRVYEFALISPKQIMIPGACKHKQRYEAAQPALSRTSRQVRAETLSIFYRENEFKYHVHGCDFDYFVDYMEAIGVKNRQHICRVTFVIQNRLSCGKGLLGFVRWCAQTGGTNGIRFDFDIVEWYVEYREHMSPGEEAELPLFGSPDYAYKGFLAETSDMIFSGLQLAQRLISQKRTRTLQVRDEWNDLLQSRSFSCLSCENVPYNQMKRGDEVKEMDIGHCSNKCRFLSIGARCNESLRRKEA